MGLERLVQGAKSLGRTTGNYIAAGSLAVALLFGYGCKKDQPDSNDQHGNRPQPTVPTTPNNPIKSDTEGPKVYDWTPVDPSDDSAAEKHPETPTAPRQPNQSIVPPTAPEKPSLPPIPEGAATPVPDQLYRLKGYVRGGKLHNDSIELVVETVDADNQPYKNALPVIVRINSESYQLKYGSVVNPYTAVMKTLVDYLKEHDFTGCKNSVESCDLYLFEAPDASLDAEVTLKGTGTKYNESRTQSWTIYRGTLRLHKKNGEHSKVVGEFETEVIDPAKRWADEKGYTDKAREIGRDLKDAGEEAGKAVKPYVDQAKPYVQKGVDIIKRSGEEIKRDLQRLFR